MQLLEQTGTRHDGTDVRAGPLVGTRGIEVGAEGDHVDGTMRRRVHAVDVAERPDGVRLPADRGDIWPRPDEVAGGGERHELGAL